MLASGSYVIYGTSGVCRIEDICTRNFGGGEMRYYTLCPVFGDSSVFYVPTDNEASMAKIKQVLTRDEMCALISSMPDERLEWDPDNRKRGELYTEIFKTGDRRRLIGLIKAVYNQKLERAKTGKKLGTADENAMNKAEHILYSEMALVLGIQPNEVVDYIREQLEGA